MGKALWGIGVACLAASVQAQDESLSVSVGLRAWQVDWTTFGYVDGNNSVVKQVTAPSKLVLMPQISARYGRYLATMSVFPTQGSFAFGDEPRGRREFEASLGYSLLPGLTATLGYKGIWQPKLGSTYRPRGPVLGLSANASIDGPLSMYGSVGLGWLKTPKNEKVVNFDADYRLTEVGLAYSLAAGSIPGRWTATAGYRMQVMTSKDAQPGQDGHDTTKGFTFGLLTSF